MLLRLERVHPKFNFQLTELKFSTKKSKYLKTANIPTLVMILSTKSHFRRAPEAEAIQIPAK